MQQQHALAVQIDLGAVLEQRAAGLGGEALTHEEIAIAVHEVDRHTGVDKRAKRKLHGFVIGIGLIVNSGGGDEPMRPVVSSLVDTTVPPITTSDAPIAVAP